MSTPYTQDFFAQHEALSRQSAARVVPLVLELVPAASVVDVGCGIGTWLAEFQAAGVDDYLGVDGAYVSHEQLRIANDRFVARELTQSLELGRRFDLATCLEVAEHLPEASAQTLVDSLVNLAPVVLFSAAIPHQQGSDHINEQWPDYWHAHFARRDYVAVDALRRRIWRDGKIARWYRQNLLFYVDRSSLPTYPTLAAQFEACGDGPPLSLVHPEHYFEMVEALFGEIQKLHEISMRLSLQLREINLVAFPDWLQPAPAVLRQLSDLFAALAAHPEQPRATLLLHLGQHEQAAVQLVEQASRQVSLPPNIPAHLLPAIRCVPAAFTPGQWAVLLKCCQARVGFSGESVAAVESLGAGRLRFVSLDGLRQMQPLPRPAFAN